MLLHCIITSPKETKHYVNVQDVTLPAFNGQMQILVNHAESFILLTKGNILIRQLKEHERAIRIAGGECHIRNNSVTVIVFG